MDNSYNGSAFIKYSLGIVAINKDLNSNIIEVTPIEKMNLVSGEVTDNADTLATSGKDADGNTYNSQVMLTNTITATWMPFGNGNRMTAPDVRRGERVQIFRLANSEKFYWDTIENSSTRKLETVTYAYSGTKNENEQMNENNSYTQGVSTHDGFVNLITTSKTNGEKFKYVISVDSKNGTVTIKDDVNNIIELISENSEIRIKNAAGSIFDLKGGTCLLECPESITVKTKKWDLITETMENKGELTQVGDQTHLGNLALEGGLSGSPGAGSDGSARFKGGIITEKDIVAGDISLMNHTHIADVYVGKPK